VTHFCPIYFDMHLCPFMLARNAINWCMKFQWGKTFSLLSRGMPLGQ
jgi:hypothetical protein